MSLPKIDLSKVKTLSVEGTTLNVWYTSGVFRQFENVDLAAFKAKAEAAGKTIHGLTDLKPVEPPEGGIWCQWCNERPTLPGEPCEVCRKLGADPAFIYEQTGIGEPAPESTPEPETVAFISLAEMLGLAGEQAQQLEGTTRLNFWRNNVLWMQVEHGCRATKIKLPTAVVTDTQLDDFFAAWGWQKLGNKPYYKPTPASLVQI
jgi:hypothetical protein